jgi:hypothetical protein
MALDIMIEQALYGSHAGGGYRFHSTSPGFLEDWLPDAERLCMNFGERPPGVVCPLCLFVQPFNKKLVAIVRVADQGTDDAGRPGSLAFHLLVMPTATYESLGGDPFVLADRFPVLWHERRELPSLPIPDDLPARRSVAQIQSVLQRVDGPNLLGGTQALLDGGRLVFERPEPDPGLMRALWQLLPVSSRGRLCPATFTFSNTLGFHALVTPRLGEEHSGYIEEEQMGGYPEGRYEHGVQAAAEAGDQAELDRLFNRAGREKVLRLGLILLGFMIVLSLVMNGINPAPQPQVDNRQSETPKLPGVETVHRLNEKEQTKLLKDLNQFAAKIGLKNSESLDEVLEGINQRLGTPDPNRDPGPLDQYGPAEQRIRVLLWKHHVAEYDDPKLNPDELVERLVQISNPKSENPNKSK